VPAARAGNPIRNRPSVSAPSVPVLPNQSARHHKHRDADGLEHGSLLRSRPTGQTAPHRRGDAGEAGGAADHAVEDTDAAVRHRAGTGSRAELRPPQAVHAEHDEDDPDRNPESRGGGPPQQLGTNRHADRAANQKWNEAAKLDCPA